MVKCVKQRMKQDVTQGAAAKKTFLEKGIVKGLMKGVAVGQCDGVQCLDAGKTQNRCRIESCAGYLVDHDGN